MGSTFVYSPFPTFNQNLNSQKKKKGYTTWPFYRRHENLLRKKGL